MLAPHYHQNQYLTAFLHRHKHKERTASGGIYGQRLRSHVRPQTPVTYERDNCRANTPTEYEPRCWHYTATRTTPSLVPYYYLHRQLIVPIRIRSTTDQPIVPMCLRSTDQLIDEPVLDHYHYRRWYRTTTRTDRCHACS